MRRILLSLLLLGAGVLPIRAAGLVIPVDKDVPPLAMRNHRVTVDLEDQIAVTKVEQTFRNHTNRQLEATYVFPVPKGASVREFAMWVDGKRVKGELVEAPKARQIYQDIVRRTQDPGLLEYLGSDLIRMSIFPIPPKGDQKIELSYTSVAAKDHEVVSYVYPLRADGRALTTLEEFSLKLTLKSSQPILNVYSPAHDIAVSRPSDKMALVAFEKNQAVLDKDFQLFYTTSGQDVGLNLLCHRPLTAEDGYFLMLISPRPDLVNKQQAPRDMVFVLDTSGSMREDGKMDQARKALKHCLAGLTDKDRFAVFNFATTVNRYGEGLIPVTKEQIEQAQKWVDRLEPSGGTAINDALLAALDLNRNEPGRTFTMVFFTDGQPTIGEIKPEKILGNVTRKNTANTRIFTFGVGNDLNAALLDQVAEQSRAVSTYVRPGEDLELKVSSFYGKISHPVLTNLRLVAGANIGLVEVYPPQLPDLFHGQQLVVLGRYRGTGPAAITLSGQIGMEHKEFTYEATFVPQTDARPFVEDLWARRKVGYLLDQIRNNGEKKELVEEVTTLAKKYGIATPYTSYLIVPDAPVPVAGAGRGGSVNGETNLYRMMGGMPGLPGMSGMPGAPPALARPPAPGGAAAPVKVAEFAREQKKDGAGLGGQRGKFEDERLGRLSDLEAKPGQAGADALKSLKEAGEAKKAYDEAQQLFRRGLLRQAQVDKLGVDLSVQTNNLKNQTRVQQTALRRVQGRNVLEIGGVWIDEGFDPKMPVLVIKAMSDAYFKLLDRHPEIKDVYQLGNHLVWVSPSGTALVIDTNDGKETVSDEELDKLFAAKK
jgi:Ca-activated chloride channel family protein